MAIRYCKRCGKKFDTFYGQKDYCSKRCRFFYNRELHAGKKLDAIIDKILAYCDEDGKRVCHLNRMDLYEFRYSTLVNRYKNMQLPKLNIDEIKE